MRLGGRARGGGGGGGGGRARARAQLAAFRQRPARSRFSQFNAELARTLFMLGFRFFAFPLVHEELTGVPPDGSAATRRSPARLHAARVDLRPR